MARPHPHGSQLDYIIGPRRRDDEVHICNDVRTWATRDHYLGHARIQEYKQKVFRKEREIRSGQDGNHGQMSTTLNSERK